MRRVARGALAVKAGSMLACWDVNAGLGIVDRSSAPATRRFTIGNGLTVSLHRRIGGFPLGDNHGSILHVRGDCGRFAHTPGGMEPRGSHTTTHDSSAIARPPSDTGMRANLCRSGGGSRL